MAFARMSVVTVDEISGSGARQAGLGAAARCFPRRPLLHGYVMQGANGPPAVQPTQHGPCPPGRNDARVVVGGGVGASAAVSAALPSPALSRKRVRFADAETDVGVDRPFTADRPRTIGLGTHATRRVLPLAATPPTAHQLLELRMLRSLQESTHRPGAGAAAVDVLHYYNETKDLAQYVLGLLAVREGIALRDLYTRLGILADEDEAF